jgi:hypothetical protein
VSVIRRRPAIGLPKTRSIRRYRPSCLLDRLFSFCSLRSSERNPESATWKPDDCSFKLVRINGSTEVLARAANLLIGRAAFEAARRMYPRDRIEYRQGARVIERAEPAAPAAGPDRT